MRLTKAARAKLPLSDFAVPSKAPGPGSYPEPDAAHARAAKGLAGMHHAGPAVKARIAKTARKKGIRQPSYAETVRAKAGKY